MIPGEVSRRQLLLGNGHAGKRARERVGSLLHHSLSLKSPGPHMAVIFLSFILFEDKGGKELNPRLGASAAGKPDKGKGLSVLCVLAPTVSHLLFPFSCPC